MDPKPAPCLICRIDRGRALNRIAGAGVCDACTQGAAESFAPRRGWELAVRQKEHYDRRRKATVFVTTVGLSFEGSAGSVFVCRARAGWLRVRSWVSPGVNSGDALFDRCVDVRSAQPHACRALLRRESIQSAIMELVTGESVLRVGKGRLEIKSVSEVHVSDGYLACVACVLAHHIEVVGDGAPDTA